MKDGLYLTDAQVAHRLGLSAGEWQTIALILEQSGLPLADPLFGERRYWPAVRAFLDRRAGLTATSPHQQADGKEHWEEEYA